MLREELARLRTFFREHPTYNSVVDDTLQGMKIIIRGPDWNAVWSAEPVANSDFYHCIEFVHQATEQH